MNKKKIPVLAPVVVGILLLLVCALYGWYMLPGDGRSVRFTNGFYAQDNQEPQEFTMPFITLGNGRMFTVTVDMYYPESLPGRVRFIPDDCLDSVEINGKRIESSQLPTCPEHGIGVVLDVSSYLAPGKNQVKARVRDLGGPTALYIEPDRDTTLPKILLYVCAFVLVGYIAFTTKLDR